MMPRLFFPLLLLLATILHGLLSAQSPESPEAEVPVNLWRDFSVYLPVDLSEEASGSGVVAPEWLLDFTTEPSEEGGVLHRISIEPYGHYFEFLMARLYWREAAIPIRLEALDAGGAVLYETDFLSSQSGMLSGATPIPAADVVELRIHDPGMGLKGLYLAWLEGRLRFEPVDEPELSAFRNPYGVPNQPPPPEKDIAHNGVVTALLSQAEQLRPDGEQDVLLFEFEMPIAPQRGILICDLAGPSIDQMPELYLNGHPIGSLEIQWPDLADPGFEAGTQQGVDGQDIYAGWTVARKMLPAGQLNAGPNTLLLVLPDGAPILHLRDVRLQLKFEWDPEAALQP